MSPLSPSSRASELTVASHSLMERSPVPMAELEGAEHVVRYVNPAFCRLAGKSREALTGKPYAETIQEGDTCLTVLDRVYRTGEPELHTEPEHPDHHPFYWSYAMWPVFDTSSAPIGVMMQVTETTSFHREAGAVNEALLLSSLRQHEQTEAAEKLNDMLRTEITHRRRVEDALRESEAKLRRAFEFDETVVTNMAEGLYTVDRQGLVTSMNPAAVKLFGWSLQELRGRKMHDATHHHHRDGTPFRAEDCAGFQVLETGKSVTNYEDVFIRKDGTFFPVVYSSAPLRDRENITGLVVVFRDITERKAAEERERLLARELAHRSKNMLSVFQAIVSRSLAGTRSLAEGREALMNRIQALARSQTVLDSGEFESASLAEIIRLEGQAFSNRVKGLGPDVRLNPRAAQTFALLAHELMTNAAKYGALSQPDGRIAINWSVNGANERHEFQFSWQESGGPKVAPPSRQGFGRVLVEKIVAQEFGAQPKIDFAPDGLRYQITAPLLAIAASQSERL